ncbi:LppP/LprE family lipoprotein [Rhodococcus sp. IEGM 1381]|uniref:LppP/LprE family lipoprotein n=1 Tax=Rhodococcus sp. IEGM 1381 TaxID=3047085 RepID=UPI0024B74327|nr:LppP/LprE family lipoprotein [Rhodococcus sp. IEGM 1381]
MASGWQLDEQGDPCATLAWATARIAGATSSSPETVLFFHDNTYLGTATAEQYAFTTVVDQLPDTVAVSYKWINPGDANANPTGGPALVRYQWNGSSVDMLDQLPPEVLNPPRANPVPSPAPGPAPGPAPAGNVDPATGSVCVENSARDAALASLPPFEGRGWIDGTRSYPCLPLVTFLTRPDGRNMNDDPSYLLFFHDGQYLGMANDVPYPNMSVADSGYDFITIAYRWRVPGDDPVSPGGGPALVRYQWNGSSVETIGAIPVEVTG